jgi:hypothetical protein
MQESTINDNGNQEVRFYSRLVSELPSQSRQNSNGSFYKIANIEFTDAEGTVQESTAMIYEGNYKYGLEVGKSYLTTAEFDGENVYLRLSHLEPRVQASPFMFGFKTVTKEAAIEMVTPTSKSKQVITEEELADF